VKLKQALSYSPSNFRYLCRANDIQRNLKPIFIFSEISMPTRREAIAELLEQTEYPLTAQEICDILEIRSRSIVYEDLEHIAKSVKTRKKQLLIRPARCGSCDFIFTVCSAKKPSKCPKCKSEWIIPPAYLIRLKK
jgi:predicted Zn-ribbon and HTH transcriptional regulator